MEWRGFTFTLVAGGATVMGSVSLSLIGLPKLELARAEYAPQAILAGVGVLTTLASLFTNRPRQVWTLAGLAVIASFALFVICAVRSGNVFMWTFTIVQVGAAACSMLAARQGNPGFSPRARSNSPGSPSPSAPAAP